MRRDRPVFITKWSSASEPCRACNRSARSAGCRWPGAIARAPSVFRAIQQAYEADIRVEHTGLSPHDGDSARARPSTLPNTTQHVVAGRDHQSGDARSVLSRTESDRPIPDELRAEGGKTAGRRRGRERAARRAGEGGAAGDLRALHPDAVAFDVCRGAERGLESAWPVARGAERGLESSIAMYRWRMRARCRTCSRSRFCGEDSQCCSSRFSPASPRFSRRSDSTASSRIPSPNERRKSESAWRSAGSAAICCEWSCGKAGCWS